MNINLRLPSELHKKLKQLAQKEQRSLTAQIVYILKRYLVTI